MQTREDLIREVLPDAPPYRMAQIDNALFHPAIRGFFDISTLRKSDREILGERVPWYSYRNAQVASNASHDTYKALLTLEDGTRIETVLMRNAIGERTICVSSQVGCAMRCGFCATGLMGLSRNLTVDEIIDQYRFWITFLWEKNQSSRISNIVYMGMGEPLANYEAVKQSLQTLLSRTDIGTTHITVSTVGILPRLELMLTDAEWPRVRLAISLHSAVQETRKKIVPTSYDDFLPKLRDWARRYLHRFGNRRHHLTFEYVMLRDVNDTETEAVALARYVSSIGNVKVNLIPYNLTDNPFERSTGDTIIHFEKILRSAGVSATIRKTMGDDIAAACGQLAAS